MPSDDYVTRARRLIGVPFRLHGRDASNGLDCVGLIALATARKGGVPTGYALRNTHEAGWVTMLSAQGPQRSGPPQTGDVLLLRAGPAQFHIGLWTGDSLIHADARLRRVTELPGTPPWSLIGAWKFRKV